MTSKMYIVTSFTGKKQVFCYIVIVLVILNETNCIDFESTLGHLKPSARFQVQKEAVENLINRLIPNLADKFDINIDPSISKLSGKDTFHVEKGPNSSVVKIIANTGVAAATGFNYYLKYHCLCQVSWQDQQLQLPEVLPEANVTQTFNDKFRYYQNVCTTSYSFVWWNWTQWEKHIDWMVMNSFNLVLAFNGQEAIWDRVYKKFNLAQEDIDGHFAGPAFLSWSRMGNIRGWAGPLTRSWHTRSLELQKQIVTRMREFGVITVLPGFSGHVPRAFKKLFPKTNMIQLEIWNNFNDTYCCPYLLDPTDDLFNTVGRTFLYEIIQEFGTDHVYSSDTFNEMVPFTANVTYLSNIGKSVFKAMTDVDPQAIWLLQGWMFYNDNYYWNQKNAKAFLHSVPLGKMIVLDLQSEQFPQYDRLEQYFGQPYIWCMLHNFGGTLGMFGSVDKINQGPIGARKSPNSTMIGIGLTPEGINQNYVIYDLMSETSWRKCEINLDQWFDYYARRRYGLENDNVLKAWKILKNSVYNFKGFQRIRGKYVVTRRPSMGIGVWSWYEYNDLLEAWDLFLRGSKQLNASETYLYDVVDITRQVLQVLADEYYKEVVCAFKSKDVDTFQDSAEVLLGIFDDLDKILGTNKNFLLGNWLNSAKALATNDAEMKLYEYNARNQITLWGPNGEIIDYANKQWSGLVSNYYQPRWSLFLQYMNASLVSGNSFNESEVKKVIFQHVEKPFTMKNGSFPNTPTGDTIETAREIHRRYWEKVHLRRERESREYNFVEDEDVDEREQNKVFRNSPEVIVLE